MTSTNPSSAADKGDRPVFSVIMPCYNHASYVDEAVDSVRNQTVGDWELVVIDDGSTDGSAEMVDKHVGQDDRIRLIRQPNAGPAAARNAGIAQARGKWLAFLDSDDVWYPTTLNAYWEAISQFPDARFFYGYRDRLNLDGSVTKLPGRHQDNPCGTRELFRSMFLSPMRVCHARSLIEGAGGFDEGLKSCEDYELYLRLSLLTDLHPIGVSTGLRRRHERNISTQTGFSRFQEAEVLRRFVREQGGDNVLPKELVADRLARLYYSSGRQYLRSMLSAKAAVALGESVRYRRTVKASLLSVVCRITPPLGRDDGREIPWLSPREGAADYR